MRKGEATKAEILDATGRLLAQKGVKGTGLAEIVKASRAPKGSLYFHFPGGKDELTCAALTESSAKWRARLQSEMQPAESAGHAIVKACEGLARRLSRSGFSIGCPVATTTLEVAAENDAIRAVCAHHFTSWIEYLRALFVAHGMPASRAAAFATLTLSSIEGALLLARAERSTAPLTTCGALLKELVDDACASSSTHG
mgnify:CR=1 FL=1